VRPPVECLEEHWACGERRGRCEPDRRDRVGDLRGSVGDVLAGAERGAELHDAVAVCLAAEALRKEPLGLRPVPRELTVRDGADAERLTELALDARRDPDEW